jgi:hypothetical protein
MKAIALKSFVILTLVLMSFSLMSLSDGASRKFWGWGPAEDGACGPNSNGDGGCSYGTYEQHYIFWISDGEPRPTGNVYPCACP